MSRMKKIGFSTLPGKIKITLRNKLMIYLLMMTVVACITIIIIHFTSGSIYNAENEIENRMTVELEHSSVKLQEIMNLMTGYGRSLANNLSREIAVELDGKDIKSLENDADAILKMEKVLYPDLNTALKISRCSGCFAVIDATINSEAPHAEYSRAGVYLRLSNVNSNVQLDPDIYYYRGIADIAREKEIQLHTRWNLEFNLEVLSAYLKMAQNDGILQSEDFWTEKKNLQNTWEDVMLYLVPLRGKQGEFYGVCGVDISSMFVKLTFPVRETDFGSICTVFAPIKNGVIQIDRGLLGGQDGTFLDNVSSLNPIKRKGTISYYSDGRNNYACKYRYIKLSGEDNTQWVCAVIALEENCNIYLVNAKRKVLFGILIFLIVMISSSLIISKVFATPIVKGIDSVLKKQCTVTEKTGISEIDILIGYFNTKSESPNKQELPDNIEELFKRFVEGVKRLTVAEYNVFKLYLQGYSISEIPDVAFISMSTVKKHNRNIYEKLNISSNEELMLYLDLFKRCDRITEIER